MKRIRSYRIPKALRQPSPYQHPSHSSVDQARPAMTYLPQYAHPMRHIAATELDTPHALLAAFADTTDFLLMALDHTGRLVLFNRACEQLSGYRAADVLGTTRWSALLLPDDRLEAVAIFAHQWLDRIALTGEQIWRSRTGQEWRIAWSVTLLRNANGDLTHVLCTGINRTDPIAPCAQVAVEPHQPLHPAPDERLSLARDIHDGPLQDVYHIQLQLAQLTATESPQDAARIAAAQHSARTAIATLRQLCTDWRPPALATFGLTAAVHVYTRALYHHAPQLHIQLFLQDDTDVLLAQTRLHLYRIFQAAMSNVLRHAHAQVVTVRFTWDAEQVALSITDDGQGFRWPDDWRAWAAAGQHYGLLGMEERAQLCGGAFQLRSASGRGTTVEVRLPGVVAARHGMGR